MSATTTSEGTTIDCPRCGQAHGALADHDWTSEEDQEVEVDCDGCEKPFTLRRKVAISYEASTP